MIYPTRIRHAQTFWKEPEMDILTPEQRQKAVEKLVEILPDYEMSDDFMIEAARYAVGSKQWIENIDEREEIKREIYRHLKAVTGVKLLDDRLTREDLELLEKAIKVIQGYTEEYDGLNDAVKLIKQAMEK